MVAGSLDGGVVRYRHPVDEDLEAARDLLRTLGGDPDLAEQTEVGLAQYAGDMVLRVAGDRTIVDMAAALPGVGTDELEQVLVDLGIAHGGVDAVDFTEEDFLFLRDIVSTDDSILPREDVRGFLRVVGRTMATAAEAAIALHTRSVEPRLDSPVAWVRANEAMAQLGLRMSQHMGTGFRRHLRQAVEFQRTSHAGTIRGEVLHLAVCFVDVSGFTNLAAQVSLEAIEEFVDVLESTAASMAVQHGVRLVKVIGDEVMLIGPNASDMACAGICLVDALAAAGHRSRGAVTFGDVAMVQGDYFGPVVNLASRLAGLADPGELLTDTDGRAAMMASTAGCGDHVGLVHSGDRPVRGLERPVVTFSISSVASP